MWRNPKYAEPRAFIKYMSEKDTCYWEKSYHQSEEEVDFLVTKLFLRSFKRSSL